MQSSAEGGILKVLVWAAHPLHRLFAGGGRQGWDGNVSLQACVNLLPPERLRITRVRAP